MKILVRAPFTAYTGYGHDSFYLTSALVKYGCDVYLHPMNIMPPIPPTVAALLQKDLEAPFDLTIVHTDPAQLEASAGLKRASKYVVGWTMWEFNNFDLLSAENKLTFTDRLNAFDLLIAYSELTSEALTSHTDVNRVVLQGGYPADEWSFIERDWFGEEFNFYMEGDLHGRKNPMSAIKVFKELKDEFPEEMKGVNLHLKTVASNGLRPEMQNWCPGLFIHLGLWSDKELKEFYSRMHVLLSPSRGEGKNLPALQFLSSGGTVVATANSGHLQWLSDSYAYGLDFDLVPVSSEWPDCLWAEVDHKKFKETLLHVVRNRSEAKQKGEVASRTIPNMCSWDSVVIKFFEKIGRQFPELQSLASVCSEVQPDLVSIDRQAFEMLKILQAKVEGSISTSKQNANKEPQIGSYEKLMRGFR